MKINRFYNKYCLSKQYYHNPLVSHYEPIHIYLSYMIIMMVMIIHEGIYRVLGSTSFSRRLHTNVRSHEYSSRSHRREVLLKKKKNHLLYNYIWFFIIILKSDINILVWSKIAWWEATKEVSMGLQHDSPNPNEKE